MPMMELATDFHVSGSERTSGSMVTAGLYLGAKYQVSDVSAVRFGLRHDVSQGGYRLKRHKRPL